jgi:hypothetical protein
VWYRNFESVRGTFYNILPYLEQRALHQLGTRLPENSPAKRAALATMMGTPVETFFCPTRRPAIGRVPSNKDTYRNCDKPAQLGETDYALCVGDQNRPELGQGPASYADGNSNTGGQDWWTRTPGYFTADCTGISLLRSQIKMAHVKDGASKTHMLGEKYLAFNYYDIWEKSGSRSLNRLSI